MTISARPAMGEMAIAEMKEFAGFAPGTQRYIRRALDIGLDRDDAIALWSRDVIEETSIKVQARIYRKLEKLRGNIPDDSGIETVEGFMAPLVAVAAFDLGQNRIESFAAFRFLYERLLGAAARPWLPGAFCAAASLPHIHPERRRALLQSISEAAATAPGWSNREPNFYPRLGRQDRHQQAGELSGRS